MAVDANIGILDPIAMDFDGVSFQAEEKVYWRPEQPESPDVYWRFHGFVDFWCADPIGSINIEPWRVLRRTPKGAWIVPPFSNKWNEESCKKLVIDSTNKKWAYPTKKEAWDSFCIRLVRREQHWDREGERITALKRVVASEAPGE